MADSSGLSPPRTLPRAASSADVGSCPAGKQMTHVASRADVNNAINIVTEGERDALKVCNKVNKRLCRVGLTLPGVEVRWENLLVELEPPRKPVTNALRRAAAALSSFNSASIAAEGAARAPSPVSTSPAAAASVPNSAVADAKCNAVKPRRSVILDAGSGVLPPGRMCLLLGPPGAGRTTLLKALAGQLVPLTCRRRRRGTDGGPGSTSSSKLFRRGTAAAPTTDSAFELPATPAAASGAGPRPPAQGDPPSRDKPPADTPVARAGPLRVTGSVSYNGIPADGERFEVARAATYIAQTENHLPELTVEETLTFAAECQGAGLMERLHAVLSAREAAAGISPDDPTLEALMALALTKRPLAASATVQFIARMLSIDHVMDTVVGNEMLKGISGGQKRRVTFGEMAVGLAQVMMADEITNGLDAASALAIVKALRNLCELGNATILATLLQPSPEVVSCFHDVMVISGGRLVFHGPTQQLLPFFSGLGLAPLPRQCLADFAQEVTASPEDQSRYRVAPAGPGAPLPAWSGRKWVSPKRMRRAFDASDAGKAYAQQLAGAPYSHPMQDLVLHSKRYGTSAVRQWLTVMRREATLFSRNTAFFAAGVVQVVATAFLVSTGFVNLKHRTLDDANLFMSVIFFSLMTLFMSGFNFAPIYCSRLPVFYKQRDHRFYSPAAYAVSAVVMRLPDVVVQAVSYTVMVYFSVGFALDAGRFFLFLLNMLVAGLNSVTTFSLIASIMRNESATQGMGAVIMMVSVLLSGFPIAPSSIPGWWIWFHWMTPMSWGLRSMLVVEFTSDAWPFGGAANGMSVGEEALDMRGIYTDWKWVWAGIGTVLGISLLQLVGQIVALTFLGPLRSSRGGPDYLPDDDPADEPLPRNSWTTGADGIGRNSRRRSSFGPGPRELVAPVGERWAAASSAQAPGPAPTPASLTAAPGGRTGNPPGLRGNQGQSPSYVVPATSRPAASPAPLLAVAPVTAVLQPPARPPAAAGPASANSHAMAAVDVSGAVAASAAPKPAASAIASAGGSVGGAHAVQMAAAAADGDQVLAFRPVVMAFRDVSYFVVPNGEKKEIQLLNRVSGVFRPGVLTSLMGASGAGKTTLMDVLAGRKTGGRVEGSQLVNGAPKRMSTFARLMGYVEQLDVHNAQATVEEALVFSAHLRVGSDLLPPAAVKPFVRHMMQVVELGPLAHRIIGVPGPGGGLSTEARKRLTIAVELVANPAIVFMDEPTSGLDARAAALVMRAVRNTVATGRTVVCTIHQPNREIMNQFDELLLLKPGGRTIYFGPLGEEQSRLVAYLGAVPGVSGYEPYMNPANWMLEVTSPEAEAALGVDFADVWEASEPAGIANQLIGENCQPPDAITQPSYRTQQRPSSGAGRGGSSKSRAAGVAAAGDGDLEMGGQTNSHQAATASADDRRMRGAEGESEGEGAAASMTTRFAQPPAMQLWLLLRRGVVSHWRNLPYNGMRFAVTFVLAWALGSLYWGLGDDRGTQLGVINIMGVMFSGSLFVSMTNLMMVMPLVMSERAVFYREKASGMYRGALFAAAQGLAELPFLFVQSVLYVVIIYTTIHFEFDTAKALWFWLYMFLGISFGTYMGIGVMNITPNMPAAIATCSGCVLLWNLFCGFLIYRKDIKPWYLWAYYANPFTYVIYGCVTTQMGDLSGETIDVGGKEVSVAQYIQDTFDYDYDMRGWIVLILLAFILTFRLFAYVGLTRFNFQLR